MAKVKSAGLRNYVGRLGGSVYYMNKGQNVARELAPEVSNPRTPAQMRQRMQWSNLVSMYRANKSWMGHLSFENKKQTWSDYNAFMSANLGKNPVYLAKSVAEHYGCILAPYTMTAGSLASIEAEFDSTGPYFATDIKITADPSGKTVGELSADIVANNDGWQDGDQLSIVIAYTDNMYNPIIIPIEVVLDPNDSTPLIDIESRYANLDDMLGIEGTGFLYVDASAGVTYNNYGVCIVHSRTIAGRTIVSSQDFVLSSDALAVYRNAGTDAAFQNAAESYGLGADYFLAAGYQDGEGGGGGSIIRSFTGVYQPNSLGEDESFTITNGGSNTFKASDADALRDTTVCTLVAGVDLEGSEYSLSFIASGGANYSIGQVTGPIGGRVLTFECVRSQAVGIQNKAGTFALCAGDEYDPTTIVASWEVTQ